MKSLIFIVVLVIANPSYAIDFEKYKYVIITENKCENIDAAIEKFEILREYENLKAPNKQHNKCGKRYDGKLGCISITESSDNFFSISEISSSRSSSNRDTQSLSTKIPRCSISEATTRISLMCYNTQKDVDACIDALMHVRSIFDG